MQKHLFEELSWPDRFASLEFWGTGDEAYENWMCLIELARAEWSMGDENRLPIIYKWAKSDAENSKVWWQNEYGNEKPDIATGQFR